jgi:hypothetical protein
MDRNMDWQRNQVLPLQEMFGQVGIGRFWERKPCFPEPDAFRRECCRRSFDVASHSSSRHSFDHSVASLEHRRDSMTRSMSLAAALC